MKKTLEAYFGFGLTVESLHLGNLLGIGSLLVPLLGPPSCRLDWWRHRSCGVGDPSGKFVESPELDLHTLDRNILGITRTFSTIFGSNSVVILNNYDWWKDFSMQDFLKQVDRFARIGIMITKESVKKRLESEQGMGFTEFTYQLLQGYDFLCLFRNEGVNLQIGGSDQWCNTTAGTEIIRKILQPDADNEVYSLTFPPLLKSDGTKFGKSEDGAIWLSPVMLSPYKFNQYFFFVPNADAIRFLRILNFLDLEEIDELGRDMKKPGYVPSTAQRRLAQEVTRFVHGEEGLIEALKATEALRHGAETKLDWKTIEAIAEDVSSCSLAYDQVLNSSLFDLSVSLVCLTVNQLPGVC